MRVLVMIATDPEQRLLVRLHTAELKRQFRELVMRRRNSQAIVAALTRGQIEREVRIGEIGYVNADLIISERNQRWNLCT